MFSRKVLVINTGDLSTYTPKPSWVSPSSYNRHENKSRKLKVLHRPRILSHSFSILFHTSGMSFPVASLYCAVPNRYRITRFYSLDTSTRGSNTIYIHGAIQIHLTCKNTTPSSPPRVLHQSCYRLITETLILNCRFKHKHPQLRCIRFTEPPLRCQLTSALSWSQVPTWSDRISECALTHTHIHSLFMKYKILHCDLNNAVHAYYFNPCHQHHTFILTSSFLLLKLQSHSLPTFTIPNLAGQAWSKPEDDIFTETSNALALFLHVNNCHKFCVIFQTTPLALSPTENFL